MEKEIKTFQKKSQYSLTPDNERKNNDWTIEQYNLITENDEKQEKFKLNIYFSIKEVFDAKKRNIFIDNPYGDPIPIDRIYKKIWTRYCIDNSQTRSGHEPFNPFNNSAKDVDERKRFSKSNLIGVLDENNYIIGGAWIEPMDNFFQQFHIFISEKHESKNIGKNIESLISKYLTTNLTKSIGCFWSKKYNRPEKFFKKIGYRISNTEFYNSATKKINQEQ